MLNWNLLLFICCFWSSALVVNSAALTASQLDARVVCRFVKTSMEKKLRLKPDSLYITAENVRVETERWQWGSVFQNWKLISKMEPLARDFLDYCLNVPNTSKMEDICAQFINESLQHNNDLPETNYLNGTTGIGLLTTLKLIRTSSNSENFDPLSRVDSPLQLFRTSTSLSRVFLTIYLAGNPDIYHSLDWKLTASEPILCVQNPISNTYCSTTLLTTEINPRQEGLTRVSVSMGKDPRSTENMLNQYTLDLATYDFVDYQTYCRDRCAILLPNSTLNDSEFITCVSFYLQRFRNAILYRYNRLLIGQNVAYWHSGLLGDICGHITPNHGPGELKCPSISLRQRGVSWLKSLLCIGLILASFTTLLNFVVFWLFAFRRGQKENRLRPYVLNIALIGTLWGLLDAFDYLMMLLGYEMLGDPNAKIVQVTPKIYYHCCSDNLWAPMPSYSSNRIDYSARYFSNFHLSGTYGSCKMNLLIYSISIFLTTYTLQVCCIFTFLAIGVIQVCSLMWPFMKPACMDKPKHNLCFLWVVAVLISISVTGPLAATNIHEVRVNTPGLQIKNNAGQENQYTTDSVHNSVALTSYLTGSADGDSLLLQASILYGVVIAVLLQSIDGLLAVTLTIMVCYIRKSSSRTVRASKKNTAGTRNANDGKMSAPTPRIVLVTVIMASGISCMSAIPMLNYLLTTHHLADTATCDYDAYSQTVTFDLAMTYLLGRFFLLLSPFANPILVAIRYRAVLFPTTIYGPNDNVPMRSNEKSSETTM